MKWLLLFCLLAVHQISAMPNKKEEEEDKLDVRADEFNEELRVEEESKLIHKRPVEFDTEEGEEAEEEDKEERKLNSRKKRCEKGCGGEDDSSEENLDVDVNVNFNAHQPNFKADVDVNVNINAEGDCASVSSKLICNEGWNLFEDSCYFFGRDLLIWQDARQICLDNDGDLVKIDTDSEFYFLQKNLTTHTWIGLNDLEVEGVYRWVSDNSIHDVAAHRPWWHGPQPLDGGAEDCGHFLYRDNVYLLNDVNCDWSTHYICEKEPSQTTD